METKTNLEIALDWEDKITLELHRQLMTKYYPNKKPSQVTDDELLHIWECEVNAPKEGGTAEPETQNVATNPVQGAALEAEILQLRRDNEVLRGMLFDIVAFYYQGEFKESFKMILPEIKELLTPKP